MCSNQLSQGYSPLLQGHAAIFGYKVSDEFQDEYQLITGGVRKADMIVISTQSAIGTTLR